MVNKIRIVQDSFTKLMIYFSVLFLSGNECYSQKQDKLKLENSELEQLSVNKTIIPQFKYQTLKALSHYPELENARIVFKNRKIKTSLACRPSIFSFFLRKQKRTYYIFVNNDTVKLKDAILPYIPETAQIGVIGHELGHIVDYHNKTFFGLFYTGLGYLFKGYKSKLEKRVDKIAVNHGLKKELMAFNNYVINVSNAPQEYKNYKKKIYYSYSELEGL